jgi:DNA-binding SARP family transcriptional activator
VPEGRCVDVPPGYSPIRSFSGRAGWNSTDSLPDKKNRALLAYLALESNRPHRRESLAALFWPNQPETKANNSLRQSLYLLRHLTATDLSKGCHLLISSEQVQLNADSDLWIDVVEFENLLAECKSHHPGGEILCNTCRDRLDLAIKLYQGELLAGLSLPRCSKFDDWQVYAQESCHNQALAAISMLSEYFEAIHDYVHLIVYAQKEIELEPWRETAHQRKMMALAMSGQHDRALLQYESLRTIIQRDLGAAPSDETVRLYKQIVAHALPGPIDYIQDSWGTSLYLSQSEGNSFTGRRLELARLSTYLEDALIGRGRVAFIRGEAGMGKTALMNEFARRAMQTYPDLLVASGSSSGFSGSGTTYQPFREILGMLAGIHDAPRTWTGISPEHSRRLHTALPAVLQTLQDTSPGLVGTLIPVSDLILNAHQAFRYPAANSASQEALLSLEDLVWQTATYRYTSVVSGPAPVHTSQKPDDLIDQVARLLLRLSRRFPLLLILDDLQWADSSSVNLLFHLGKRLAGGRILILGAYRPEDTIPVALGEFHRHPLVALINEFQRLFSDLQVDLSQADGRALLRDYLESQQNHLDQDFQEKFYQLTGGNALFIVELLRDFQERGELLQERAPGLSGPCLDWERLPTRVEAIISERLSRLDPTSRSLLDAASVQGEVFDAVALAHVLGVNCSEVTTRLSGILCKHHQLVSSLDFTGQDDMCESRYRFRHLLDQKYLYQSLDYIERARLHQATFEALARMRGKAKPFCRKFPEGLN